MLWADGQHVFNQFAQGGLDFDPGQRAQVTQVIPHPLRRIVGAQVVLAQARVDRLLQREDAIGHRQQGGWNMDQPDTPKQQRRQQAGHIACQPSSQSNDAGAPGHSHRQHFLRQCFDRQQVLGAFACRKGVQRARAQCSDACDPIAGQCVRE